MAVVTVIKMTAFVFKGGLVVLCFNRTALHRDVLVAELMSLVSERGLFVMNPIELGDWLVTLAVFELIEFLVEVLGVLLLIVVVALVVAMVVVILSVVVMVLAVVVDVSVVAMLKRIVLVPLVVALGWACVARVPCVALVIPRTIGRLAIVVAAVVA